jgi:protein-L-isoaspartate(D-aspartate) O-methyltransferase
VQRESTERLKSCRTFFANLVTASAGISSDSRLTAAFASTPRERFLGSGPWRVFTPIGYIHTPSDDPAFLYQDITVALEEEGSINNGQPALHAFCLAALNIQEGEAIVHIGAGTGYYTTLLSKLTGPTGSLDAFEVESRLAERATSNLADLTNVKVHNCSGSDTRLPMCDVIYVNAGATAPRDTWLDALRPGGRLLFPLTPAQGHGAMLLVKRTSTDNFEARFLCLAMFMPCAGARDDRVALRLSDAFKRGDLSVVRSLRRSTPPDETCWFPGPNWWLSTAAGA